VKLKTFLAEGKGKLTERDVGRDAEVIFRITTNAVKFDDDIYGFGYFGKIIEVTDKHVVFEAERAGQYTAYTAPGNGVELKGSHKIKITMDLDKASRVDAHPDDDFIAIHFAA